MRLNMEIDLGATRIPAPRLRRFEQEVKRVAQEQLDIPVHSAVAFVPRSHLVEGQIVDDAVIVHALDHADLDLHVVPGDE